jgi:hypothetical protein
VRLYADLPTRAARQVLTDLFAIVWVYAWVRISMWVYDLVEKLAVPGRKLQGAGSGLADNLAGAGKQVGRIPAVGDDIAKPFDRAADAARSLADAGQQQQEIVHQLAIIVVAVVLALPLSLVLFGWLPLRIRWMRRAGAADAVKRAEGGEDLLALRALATQPLRRLTTLDPDIAQAWRRDDPAAVSALAALELRRLGLRR